MTAKDRTATEAYTERRRDIASILDWIECELEKDADGEITWDSVASIGVVKQRLKENLTFLSGASGAEIERNLEELRM